MAYTGEPEAASDALAETVARSLLLRVAPRVACGLEPTVLEADSAYTMTRSHSEVLDISPRRAAGLFVVSLLVALTVGSCTADRANSGSTLSPSSASVQKQPTPELSALAGALPSTATVFGSADHGQWGNVVVVSDSPGNMAAGPASGTTFNALEVWLSDAQNRDGLVGEGWSFLLSCSSSVNQTASGSSYIAGSEMIPLESHSNIHASVLTVKTGQPTDTANNTTIECPS